MEMQETSDPKIHMEMQETSNSQNNLEGEKSGRAYTFWFQNSLHSYSNQDSHRVSTES